MRKRAAGSPPCRLTRKPQARVRGVHVREPVDLCLCSGRARATVSSFRICRIGPGASLRPGPPKNRTCTFQRIRLKQAGEGPVARRRTIRSRSWSVSSAGPFTATLVAASNLSVGSGVVVMSPSLAHLTASARFRARAPGPVSGRLCGTAAWRGRPSGPGSPLRFRRRCSLLGHPIPAGGLGLPHGRLTGPARRRVPDLDGVTAFRTHELRPGWVPPISRGRRCSSRPRDVLSQRLPLCRGQSLSPCSCIPSAGVCFTRHQRGFTQFTRPVFPGLWPPGWNGPPLGVSPGFAPRRCRRRTPRMGQAVEHGPGTTRSHHGDPPVRKSTHCVRPRVAPSDAGVWLTYRGRLLAREWGGAS
jgi:hypothetical protein